MFTLFCPARASKSRILERAGLEPTSESFESSITGIDQRAANFTGAASTRGIKERPRLEADGFTVDQEAVSSLGATIRQLLWSTDSSAKTWETKSLNDPSGKDDPSAYGAMLLHRV